MWKNECQPLECDCLPSATKLMSIPFTLTCTTPSSFTGTMLLHKLLNKGLIFFIYIKSSLQAKFSSHPFKFLIPPRHWIYLASLALFFMDSWSSKLIRLPVIFNPNYLSMLAEHLRFLSGSSCVWGHWCRAWEEDGHHRVGGKSSQRHLCWCRFVSSLAGLFCCGMLNFTLIFKFFPRNHSVFFSFSLCRRATLVLQLL